MSGYREKVITTAQALDLVKSNYNITLGMAAAEPVEFLTKLHTIADRVEDVRVTGSLPTVLGEYMNEKYLEKSFMLDNWFYSPLLRRLHKTGRVSFLPNCLRFAAARRNQAHPTDIFITSATLPDKDGNVRLSCSNVYEMEIARAAKTVILEVGEKMPRLDTDAVLNVAEVDWFVECDYALPTIPEVAPNEKDRVIGRYIAELIRDGDVIQVGIGGIPNAVCAAIKGKRDLGIHTEMLTTGIMDLIKAGTVTNSKKTLNPGKSVFTFMYGSQALYDFADGNRGCLMLRGSYVNHPFVLAQNDNMVSINTTVEVDLMGQCASESVGHTQISGTGGQSDTAMGAQEAKNGRSIIALYSTVALKDRETGETAERSKIVPLLKPGAAVSLSRNEVDWVVTEYGAVRLRGLNLRERAEKLISIAHPKFREELDRAAHEYGFKV